MKFENFDQAEAAIAKHIQTLIQEQKKLQDKLQEKTKSCWGFFFKNSIQKELKLKDEKIRALSLLQGITSFNGADKINLAADRCPHMREGFFRTKTQNIVLALINLIGKAKAEEESQFENNRDNSNVKK